MPPGRQPSPTINPGQPHLQRLRHHHAADVSWLRAERHADANFPAPLGHRVGHDAVQPAARQEQGQGGESADQRGVEARCRD